MESLLKLAFVALCGALSTAHAAAVRPDEVAALLLQASRTEALKQALDEDDIARKRGTPPALSFPVSMCLFEGGFCGAVNRDGTIAVAPEFDWVGDFREGRALVRKAGLYGYVDTAGRHVVEPQYVLAGEFWRGFAEVSVDGKSALIDEDGRQILVPTFARALPFNSNAFWVKDGERRSLDRDGAEEFTASYGAVLITQIETDGTWKLVDRRGDVISAPKISTIQYFGQNRGDQMWARTEVGWGLIAPDGSWAQTPMYEQVGSLHFNRASVRLAGKWGYVDNDGRIVIKPTFEQAGSFSSSSLAPVQLAGRWGYIDLAGTFVIQPQFDSAESFASDGLAIAKLGGLSGLIDRSGSWVVEPRYQRISRIRSHFWVETDGKFGVLDSEGKRLASPQFTQTGKVCGDGWVVGYAHLEQRAVNEQVLPPTVALSGLNCEGPLRKEEDGKFGYVDRMMRPITKAIFEVALSFSEGAAAVKLNGKFGYIKDDGTWLIEPRFERARPFAEGSAIVGLNGKLGYIKSDGTWLVAPSFDEAEPFLNGVALVKLEGKHGIINSTGTWLTDTVLERTDLSRERGLSPIKSNQGKWGFVDPGGTVTIEMKYDAVLPFARGIAWVRESDGWCPVDKRGDRVRNLQCREMQPRRATTLQAWPG